MLRDSTKEASLKTISVYKTLHSFYKETALFYQIDMSILVSNILEQWMQENKNQVAEDRIKMIKERGY